MIEENEASQFEVELSDLSVRAGSQQLLEASGATIPAGKITLIVGASGAGKSVLLRILAGLIPQQDSSIRWSGDISIRATDISSDDASITNAKRRIGIVFQQFALFDELSSIENVQFAIDHACKSPPQAAGNDTAQSANRWLDELGVPTSVPVSHLSGGQKQRLAIARTLAANPSVLLYDEPTSGLDAASGSMVATLIRRTQQAHQRTSIVVTHDYATLLGIADEVLFFDGGAKQLIRVPSDQWQTIATRMHPVARDERSDSTRGWLATNFDALLCNTGFVIEKAIALPFSVLPLFPRIRWGLRFIAHYLWLIGGPSAWIYLILAGLIIGFTSTYFTFRFLPFRLYTQPLLIDELLSSIGFALYRVLVPVLATILIAARCGAAVAADVGVKRYGGQVDALKTLGVPPRVYLLSPIVIAFIIATPILEWLAFSAAKTISLITFLSAHTEISPYFWQQHFYRNLEQPDGGLFYDGWTWVFLKNTLCGFGTATIAYYQGLSPKSSARDVSNAITSTVLWTTLFVLVIHFLVALVEF